MHSSNIELSIIVPCYNESAALPLFRERLVLSLNQLNLTWEALFVDDGSQDDTRDQLALMHGADARFKVIALSRNFGHQAAIAAGLAHAGGDLVAVMDADLQDPPELLAPCVEKLNEGYDVVYAVWRKREGSIFKGMASAIFYRMLRLGAEVQIPLDAGDFCVMKRIVVRALNQLPERDVFVRGLRAWTGFRQIGLPFERDARIAGDSKYSFRKLLRLARDGIFGFSLWPLRMATYGGCLVVGLAILAGLFLCLQQILGVEVPGSIARKLRVGTAIAITGFFLGGLQLVVLGVLGEYLGRIYTEVKQRPRWIIKETIGIRAAEDESRDNPTRA